MCLSSLSEKRVKCFISTTALSEVGEGLLFERFRFFLSYLKLTNNHSFRSLTGRQSANVCPTLRADVHILEPKTHKIWLWSKLGYTIHFAPMVEVMRIVCTYFEVLLRQKTAVSRAT